MSTAPSINCAGLVRQTPEECGRRVDFVLCVNGDMPRRRNGFLRGVPEKLGDVRQRLVMNVI